MFHLPVIILMGASILWGLSWLPLKYINEMGVDGVTLIFLTYGLLTLLLSPLLFKYKSLLLKHKSALFLIALLGGGANLTFTYSLIHGDVIRVMVLFYLLPVWGVLGGKFFLKESVDSWRYLGVVLAISGAFIILGGFKAFESPPSWIDLIALFSGLLFAMNNIMFRVAQDIPVSSKVTMTFLGCFVFSGFILFGFTQDISLAFELNVWMIIIAYAVAWLLIANIGSQWGVTHMEAGRSSIIIILELITAVLSASFLAGERMTMYEYIGGALILSAAFIEAIRTKDDDIPQKINNIKEI